MNNPAIELKNVSISFDNKVRVINNVSFTIDQGEIIAIIGPNGSGKTTLIKAILGLTPFEGKIKVFTKDIGYVPQRFTFDKTFPLTVRELLEISIRKHKNSKNINESLEEVEMIKHQDQLIGNLSGGQLQRTLIACALVNEPKILFLDEPTAGIDIEGEKSFYQIIKNQKEQHGVTSVMISHEVSMVYKYATKIVCLNRDLVCEGTPKEAINKEVLGKLYGTESEFRLHKH